MSLTKSATRRLSLMAGSSLVAGAIAAASSVPLLAPTAALAANECGVQVGSTPIVCNATAYAGGVTYDANGNLVVTFTPTTSNIGGNGVVLTGSGSESITFDSAATSTELQSSSLVGALLDVSTVNGAINISTEEMDADGLSPAGVTHAIRAIASGSGDVGIMTTGTVDADSNSNPAGSIGIEARSLGGGDVTITTGATTAGRQRAILASTTGAGRTELILNGSASGGGAEVSSGSGGFLVEINSGTSTFLMTSGPAGGEVLVGADAALRSLNTVTAANSTTAIEVDGNLSGTSSAPFLHTASGSGRVVLNIAAPGQLNGSVDYSALTGGAEVTVGSRTDGGGWSLGAGLSSFSQGDDILRITEDGIVAAPAGVTTVDFLSGNNSVVNGGVLLVGESTGAATLALQNLGSGGFEHSGLIIMGHKSPATITPYNVTDKYDANSDLQANDTLVLRNSRFIGNGGRIYLDVVLGAETQTTCATLTAADCIDLQGTTTEGTTLMRVFDASPSFEAFRNDGIVLVDVGGGSSSAGAFDLDPTSHHYDSVDTLGSIIRKGLIAYDLIYDEDTEQHVLVGVAAPEAYQFQLLPGLALNAWRTTAGTWFDRQADLRDTLAGPGLSKGMWTKAAGDFTTRDLGADFVLRGDTLTFDQSHEQKTGSLVIGADLVSAESDDRGFVFGAVLGFTNSVTEFDASPTKMEFTGPTGGLYASYVGGPMFLDGMVSASLLNMNQDSPGLNLGEGVRLKQDITVVGAQLEGGWRMQFSGGFFAEPLAAFSWVRTEFEDIDGAAANTLVDFDDKAASRRAALGLRVGMDTTFGPARAKYSLTGRAWNEFEGDNGLVLHLPGESMAMSDDLSGTFGEVGAGVSLSDDTGLISGFLNGNVKFQEDYRSTGFSVGVRLRW